MEIEQYEIEGLLSFIPRRFKDERGLFFESFNQNLFEEMVGRKVSFVQDNESHSKLHVLRGMHLQKPPFAQGKLVRVIKGKVIDVAVDIRKSSATYGQHVKVELSGENGRVLWIPEGFAHGFLTLEDDTIFNYKCTNFYHPQSEMSLCWNDSLLNINWEIENPTLSDKDSSAPKFEDFNSPFS
ncbi:MAG: dTDP-4-dehydrorhamnose 3,5-epimerase [Flavobacteriales bacterium]|nr:dTDP-4-dehydrorhamnose 3,5-epimerase [Flavobacteriales bacterium]